VPCVVGCEPLEIDLASATFTVAGQRIAEGAPLSVDGATGRVYGGVLPLEPAAQAASHIDRILHWSDAQSKATFWIGGVSGPDVPAELRQHSGGLGVVALTDLMISAGTLGDLLAAINDLGQQPDRRETQDRLARLAYDATRRLVLESGGAPIDLRLPNLGSPRAQRLIDTWASLAPRLFLPLGLKSLYVSLLRGLGDAAREAGHGRVTPLVPGINGVEELQAFQRAAEPFGFAAVGAVLQSPAGLAAAEAITASAAAVWIDIREVIRTFYGYPSALSFGDDVFESYVGDGYLRHNPRTTLGAQLREAIGAAVATARAGGAARLGVECGDGAALSLVEDLYATGVRMFSVPAASMAGVRLALGQMAVKSDRATKATKETLS
jgi:pyruvate, orthophosphate dikinase